MTIALHINAPESYALALGLNDQQVPVCLVLSPDSLSVGGEAAIHAEYFTLEGSDVRISGPQGVVVLQGIEQACLDAVNAKLPLVVIDPANEREVLVALLEDLACDIYRE